jgi:hypothetical protein
LMIMIMLQCSERISTLLNICFGDVFQQPENAKTVRIPRYTHNRHKTTIDILIQLMIICSAIVYIRKNSEWKAF